MNKIRDAHNQFSQAHNGVSFCGCKYSDYRVIKVKMRARERGRTLKISLKLSILGSG